MHIAFGLSLSDAVHLLDALERAAEDGRQYERHSDLLCFVAGQIRKRLQEAEEIVDGADKGPTLTYPEFCLARAGKRDEAASVLVKRTGCLASVAKRTVEQVPFSAAEDG